MATPRIIELAKEIREHERHHHDGACFAPSGGCCPMPDIHDALGRAWQEAAEADPAQYGWAKYRRKIATYLPDGAWEHERPQIAWGKCQGCGSIGPVFFVAGGKPRCLECLEKEAI